MQMKTKAAACKHAQHQPGKGGRGQNRESCKAAFQALQSCINIS